MPPTPPPTATTDADGARTRVRARVDGTVQGVGFRPFVYRLAAELGLGGWVRNDERGVLAEVEGDPAAVRAFLARVGAEAPPLARVERVVHETVAPRGEDGFAIAASLRAGDPSAPVAADTATCDACLAELHDPADRRYRHPFVNCTDCGPRFTIVTGVPYDRERTTMAGFTMCDRCRAEYEDPASRRFHAEPNACPDCGPRARLLDGAGGAIADGDAAVRAAAAALRDGRIVAVKGLGGYHLACRADDEEAVAALRARKHREEQPFAVMVAGVDRARSLVALAERDAARLTAASRPIVLAPRRPGAPVAPSVAPRCAELGVLLPYTALHHLLLADVAGGRPDGPALVMTSGNRSTEPIAHRDDDALERLAGIADAFLVHDRPIHVRTDDSVVRGPVLLRRSRGIVPAATPLPLDAPPLLAVGAELKSTFCLAVGRRAWVGHHIGDLRTWETLRAFREGVAHFERLFAVAPRLVAHDLHPDYRSTTEALAREGTRPVAVQHHHAHLAACLAEHGEMGPAVGAIFDGAGYGPDGTVWGGELLVGGLAGFERAGHLRAVALPGGDRAAREPWRMACAWLVAAGRRDRPDGLADGVPPGAWDTTVSMVDGRLSSPPTTSAGRLFDAVAALCGLRSVATYEGQAAMELEAVADPDERGAYPLELVRAGDMIELDGRPLIAAVADDVAAGRPPATVSARFHNALGAATDAAVADAAAAAGIGVAVLSGGVFQNRRLLEDVRSRLTARGLRVLVPQGLPPGDGGISFGQAAVAAARHPG